MSVQAEDSVLPDSFWGAEHSVPGFAFHSGPSSFVVCLSFECFYFPVGIGPGGYHHHPNFLPHSYR